MRARGVAVPGVVTGLVRSTDNDGHTFRPIFRFTTLQGHELELTSKYGEASPPRPGETVTILYDPQKPRHALIDTGGQRGSRMGWIVTVLGLFLAALSVLTALDVV